ncbi:hypothetical protein Va1_033 [Vibrio phage Va1]|nr:hypothetical protein Va1_033 [Vibrio phage Va1]
MKHRALIISAFPACGKSWVHRNNTNMTIMDSDSSKFSWILDSEGNSTGERDPNFPANYIQHIRENLESADIIMVSSHDEVRDALQEAGLKWFAVTPSPDLKHEWIGRCWLRDPNTPFLKALADNWDSWTNPSKIEQYSTCQFNMLLTQGQYLSHVIGILMSAKKGIDKDSKD